MKKQKVNLMKFGSVLGRDEMRKVMAGSGGGNIYCMFWGGQWQCNLGDLQACTESCADYTGCEGCAQFPP